MEGSRRAYFDGVNEDGERSGILFRQGIAAIGSLSITAALMAVIVGLALHEVPPLPSLAVIAAIIIGLNPVNRGLSRTIQRGTLPTRLHREDAQELWDDVVNATLLSVLEVKGIPVALATAKATGRGLNHTRYVASVAQELRTNHADRPGSRNNDRRSTIAVRPVTQWSPDRNHSPAPPSAKQRS